MTLDEQRTTHLAIPKQRKPIWRKWLPTLLGLGTLGLAGAFFVNPSRLWSKTTREHPVFKVERGDMTLVVTENGVLESANNATVRCEVEALVGVTGGVNGTGRGGASGSGGSASPAPAATASPAVSAMQGKGAAAAAATKAGGTKARVAGGGVASATPAAAPAAGAGSDSGASSSTMMKRPDIRSFSYIVEPHVPLRGPRAPTTTGTQGTNKQANLLTMGSSGGRGGGGNRGGRGGSETTELPGSTRIIEIIPEGTRVTKGDIVCKLDSSAFTEELLAQEIRYIQAKAWLEQAKSILEVNEISHEEYVKGVYPQDLQLIRQYIISCRTEQQRASLNYKWSAEAASKGYRANAQVKADKLAEQQTTFMLTEAIGMEQRLKQFTMPRIMKARLAKIEAIKADLSSQEAAFELENQRLKRLKAAIENCTMRAPRDGIVVYANQTNSWGRVEAQIQEGVTVRQTQPIFYVPDPKNMRVKARINESKTSLVQVGQRVIIRVDAFPKEPLTGTVETITAIPAPSSISNLDVRVYYAMISLDKGGFEGLRPGMSAEVNFRIETQHDIVRVPHRTIRWLNDQPYTAVAKRTQKGTTWDWRKLKLGISDARYVEVIEGLSPGEQVSEDPKLITVPTSVAAKPGTGITPPVSG